MAREYSLTMETKLPLALASGFNRSANYMGFSPIAYHHNPPAKA
jgi:hypothetical protein